MAPELANAQDVLGYDVYDDKRFRDAIERSSHVDRPVATLLRLTGVDLYVLRAPR